MQTLYVKNENDLSSLRRCSVILSQGCVTALGFFDGVHTAHRALIEKAKLEAEKLSLPLVIFTFSSDSVLLKSGQNRLLTDKERLSELESLGADLTLMFNFDFIKNLSAEEFIDEILVTNLNTHTAVCGFNFRFGKNASGDTAFLKSKLSSLGKETIILPEYKIGEASVSSSLIRSLLSKRELLRAARLLGKPFFVDGMVSHGLGLGRKLGIPTVNLDISREKLILEKGVYYTAVQISDKLYGGITNLGNCPTFEERETHAETFILNFDGEIYDENIRVYFISFIRDEIKFSSKEELIMQINIDKNRALSLEKEIQWQEIGLSLQ